MKRISQLHDVTHSDGRFVLKPAEGTVNLEDINFERIRAGVSVISLIFNEIQRLPLFLEHYRSIGVANFFLIDNGSTDGTPEILRDEPDVFLLRAVGSYGKWKAQWRSDVADAFLTHRWVIFSDLDERIVFPTRKHQSISEYCALLDRTGCDALQGLMVDVYRGPSIMPLALRGNQDSHYFDPHGYYRVPWNTKVLDKWPTPRYSVRGGPRLRVFQPGHQIFQRSRLSWWSKWSLGLGRFRGLSAPASGYISAWESASAARLLGEIGTRATENLLKLPLIKWKSGTKFRGSNHQVSSFYRLSNHRAAILHFFEGDDFPEKVLRVAREEKYANGSQLYKIYAASPQLQRPFPFYWSGSVLFTGRKVLRQYGLLRGGWYR